MPELEINYLLFTVTVFILRTYIAVKKSATDPVYFL